MFRLIKKIKDKGRWRIFKLKLIDARLYFVSIFVGLLTGLVAVPYHYLLQFFFNLRHDFFDSHPKWYWYIPLFLLMWGILVFVSWLVKKMPLITGGVFRKHVELSTAGLIINILFWNWWQSL
mgnify:CR=1 FL=1